MNPPGELPSGVYSDVPPVVIIYYEIDSQDIKTVLRIEEYGGDVDGAWVLLAMDEG